MVWAAHESRSFSVFIVEHESIAHLDEARHAVAIVNRSEQHPLRLLLGVEFKATLAVNDDFSRRFSEEMIKMWGQGETAWIVGVGAKAGAELARLVARFQKAKQIWIGRQLEKLNHHLGLTPPLKLADLLSPDGNVTARTLCYAVAKTRWPDADGKTLIKHIGAVRAMLNPGGLGYEPFPSGLPSYQELIEILKNLGMTPTFTAQLRQQALSEMLPLLKSWGIGGLDTAGIEPDDPNAECDIQHFIELAGQHGLALFGGSDYRGIDTGWTKHASWMDHPLIRTTMTRMST